MSRDQMIEELRVTLNETVQLLQTHGDKYVSLRLNGRDRDLRAGDLGAVQNILIESTGSMGSLNDVWLYPPEQNPSDDKDWNAINSQLRVLIERLRQQANAILTLR